MQVNNRNLCDVTHYHQRPEIKYIFHDIQASTPRRRRVADGGAELKTFATNLETWGKRFLDQQPRRLITVTIRYNTPS